MADHKVFGIGFQKTGTTTLGVIFDRLGYRVAGYNEFRNLARRDNLVPAEVEAMAIAIATGVDAVKDTPWPVFYRSLDLAFPGSKFIHVTREPAAWITSAVNDFGTSPNALHQMIYGAPYPKGHEEIWLNRYKQHNAEVEDYFSARPDDCLHLRLEEGVSFEKVCAFLGEPLVGQGVPRANTRAKKKLKMLWWKFARRF